MSGVKNIYPEGQNPLVSIIIPFFNEEDYIEDCILSVLHQSYSNLEIILVDDCSRDNSRMIADKYALSDQRIKIISHEVRLGRGPARNTGVNHACGEYFFFLDSDDLLKHDCIQVLVDNIQKLNVSILIGSSDLRNPSGELSGYDRLYDLGNTGAFGLITGEEAYKRSLAFLGKEYLPTRCWGTLIRRDTYIQSGVEFVFSEHDDLGVVPFLYFQAGFVYYIPDIVVTHCLREGRTREKSWDCQKLIRYGNLWESIQNNVVKNNIPELLGDTAIAVLTHLLHQIEQHDFDQGCLSDLGSLVNQLGSTIFSTSHDWKFALTLIDVLQNVIIKRFPQETVYPLFMSSFLSPLLYSWREKAGELSQEYHNTHDRILEIQDQVKSLEIENVNLATRLRKTYYVLDRIAAENLNHLRSPATSGPPPDKVPPKKNIRLDKRIKERVELIYHILILRRSGFMNTTWYLRKYPDVAISKIDPIQHYLLYGWRENKDPGPGFCTAEYLRRNRDVARLGMNPLLHYVRYGKKEGRQIEQAKNI